MPAKSNPPSAQASPKRKRPQQHSQDAPRKRPRPNIYDARAIAAQTSGKAFGDGEVDVDKFVKAREFEIKALEDGMIRSKKALTTRAFQNVPRDLRRRTASHNVKRVPKRLRARADRERADDNTPTVTARKRKLAAHMRLRVDIAKQSKKSRRFRASAEEKTGEGTKQDEANARGMKTAPKPGKSKTGPILPRKPRVKKNALQKPARPQAKFRKRQIHKAWLPTHLYHAKHAHMTPPKEPLWRMAIPLSPTAKSYRPTHRASSGRGGVAWDMSYMSTIGLEGPEKSIIGLLRDLGVGRDLGDGFWGKKASRWMNGSRFWDGWLYEREGWPTKGIAPAIVIWCADKTSEQLPKEIDIGNEGKKKKPEKRKAFVRVHPSAFLQLWEEILRLAKIQKPAVSVEDLRFEVGSIELIGPASTEGLVGVLHPSKVDSETEVVVGDIWSHLSSIANPGCLPADLVLAMNVLDPRLHLSSKFSTTKGPKDEQKLLNILASWPLDKAPSKADLFERSARLAAGRQLPSQKAINRRKTLSEPGQALEAVATDPAIPILLLAKRGQGGGQGRWTLLTPWKCVLPIWYGLMYYPLSTGGTLRFGGLDQRRQIAFETGTPWFPADYPGTKAGMTWEARERERRKKEWQKRPKGKRVEFDSLKLAEDSIGELGPGWSCDWEGVISGEDSETPALPIHIPTTIVARRLRNLGSRADPPMEAKSGLATVKITLLARGVPTACARIYRLPTTNSESLQKWISLIRSSKANFEADRKRPMQAPAKDAPSHVFQRHLASSILQPLQAGDEMYPQVPSKADLIGFITTGNFNLGEGKGTGLGCIFVDKVLDYYERRSRVLNASSGDEAKLGLAAETHFCIVREAGQTIGRLAKWEAV